MLLTAASWSIAWFCFVFSDELRELRTEKENLQKETKSWKAEQTKERDQEKQQHKCVPPLLDICWISNVSRIGLEAVLSEKKCDLAH